MKTRLTLLSVFVLLAVGSASAAMRYVDANSSNATPPYTNWASAAVTIQECIDAAAPGDEIVVTNGLYATGGRAVGTNLLLNRVAVDKPLVLRSVNGPQFAVIRGYQVPGTTNGDGAIRCVYLTNGASLSGFTLANGATRPGLYDPESSGGGVWCESGAALVSNCVLTGNSASQSGGGICYGTLNNCTLSGNSANQGGGVSFSTLNDCTLNSNSAGFCGGGAEYSTLNNCVLTGNSAGLGGGGGSKHAEQLHAHGQFGWRWRRGRLEHAEQLLARRQFGLLGWRGL